MTIPVADGATVATWADLRVSASYEFGGPLQLTGGGATTGPPARYGWLGAAQRSAETLGGLVLMGARLYSPVIGRFLSVDPVAGGSASAYDYGNADPVNCTDIDSRWPSFKSILTIATFIGEAASFIPGPIGAAGAGLAAVAYAANGNTTQALIMAATAAAALIGAGAIVGVAVRAPRVLKAAEAFHAGVVGAESSIKASRPIAAIAGRIWAGRGAVRGLTDNGVPMLSSGKGALEQAYRSASRKYGYGWSSNLTREDPKISLYGKSTYVNFHVNHSSKWW
jgi:RHS repeat-associated protein